MAVTAVYTSAGRTGRMDHRYDHMAKGRALRFVDADRPSTRELSEVAASEVVCRSVVEVDGERRLVDDGDEAQCAVQEALWLLTRAPR